MLGVLGVDLWLMGPGLLPPSRLPQVQLVRLLAEDGDGGGQGRQQQQQQQQQQAASSTALARAV